MADYLKPLPVDQVWGWYDRLAAAVASKGVEDWVGGKTVVVEPLSAKLLRRWLKADPSTFNFEAPNYLQTYGKILDVLALHRQMFLSEVNPPGRNSPGGVVPRIRGDSGFTRWDLVGMLDMKINSLVEVGSGLFDIARIQTRGTPQEKDIFNSLRGFQLHSEVRVSGVRTDAGHVRIKFESWKSFATDRYDWDYSEHLTVPNPDKGSKLPNAVRPMDDNLTVYHSNAKRLEDAGKAKPYDLATLPWLVTDQRFVATATVNA